MTNTTSFDGVQVAGAIMLWGASGLHWFTIPMPPPDVAPVNYVWAGMQAAAGIGGAA